MKIQKQNQVSGGEDKNEIMKEDTKESSALSLKHPNENFSGIGKHYHVDMKTIWASEMGYAH